MKKVRKLCLESNDEEFWTWAIGEVYRSHRNLPALKDELRKAGLHDPPRMDARKGQSLDADL